MSRNVLGNKNYIIAYAWRSKMLMHSRYAMADCNTQGQYQPIVQEVNYVTLILNRGRYCKSEEALSRLKPEHDS